MKRTVVKIKVQAPAARHHAMLFDENLPFRGRREEPKRQYVRKPKNKRSDDGRDW